MELVAAVVLVPFAVACGDGDEDQQATPDGVPDGSPANAESPIVSPDASAVAASRLTARPDNPIPSEEFTTGLQSLGLGRPDDAILYVPKTYMHTAPAALAVMFHGAGGDARGGINLFLDAADTAGMLLLATSSREATWDIITSGGFGADVDLLERALQMIFTRYVVDPARIAVAGFSDGASYALSVGLTNGDLFTAIMAFSPGFLAPDQSAGRPRIFISHGTQDIVLPIDQTSRVIALQLKDAGYEVEYVEFDGLHMVPAGIVDDALGWWLNGPPS